MPSITKNRGKQGKSFLPQSIGNMDGKGLTVLCLSAHFRHRRRGSSWLAPLSAENHTAQSQPVPRSAQLIWLQHLSLLSPQAQQRSDSECTWCKGSWLSCSEVVAFDLQVLSSRRTKWLSLLALFRKKKKKGRNRYHFLRLPKIIVGWITSFVVRSY